MKVSKVLLAKILLVLISCAVVVAVISDQWRIGTSGTVEIKTINVKVYSDSACTFELTSIDWGTFVNPPLSKTRGVWVKLTGDVNAILSLSTDNWVPDTASNYLVVTWNYDDSVLQSGEVVAVTFVLSVSASCPEISFGFDLVVEAVEV